MENPKVFLDMTISGSPKGRIMMENFRVLYVGNKGVSNSGKPLHYKGLLFHCVIPQFICRGDFMAKNGTRGESIYDSKVKDEFFICTAKTEWLGVVKVFEKARSNNGKTLKPVVVADCSQLS